ARELLVQIVGRLAERVGVERLVPLDGFLDHVPAARHDDDEDPGGAERNELDPIEGGGVMSGAGGGGDGPRRLRPHLGGPPAPPRGRRAKAPSRRARPVLPGEFVLRRRGRSGTNASIRAGGRRRNGSRGRSGSAPPTYEAAGRSPLLPTWPECCGRLPTTHPT